MNDSIVAEQSEAAQTMGKPRQARRWARIAVGANIAFTLSWLLAAAWQGPRYSVFSQSISDMYADRAPGAWFLILVFTLCGVAVLMFARFSLWPALRDGGRMAATGVILLSLSIFGLGDLLSPFEREGCRMADSGCTSSAQLANAGGSLDATLSTLGVLAFVIAGFFLAAGMTRVPRWRAWARPVRRATILMIVLFVGDAATQSAGSVGGLLERLVALGGAAGITALALGVLRVERRIEGPQSTDPA